MFLRIKTGNLNIPLAGRRTRIDAKQPPAQNWCSPPTGGPVLHEVAAGPESKKTVTENKGHGMLY